MTKNGLLSEEELDKIAVLAFEQTAVKDVLSIIDDCKGAEICVYGYDIINPPAHIWEADTDPPGFLNFKRHLQPIYRHAIRLIVSQEDALLIYDCTFTDGIPKDESLAAFFIALEFCDSRENLIYSTSYVHAWITESRDILSHSEELLAILEKNQELQKSN